MGKYEDPQLPNKSDGKTYDPPLDMDNKGTGTGFIPGMGAGFGADTGFGTINRIKGISAACDSDPIDKCYADEQQEQNEPGRRYPAPNGKGITASSDSDAKNDDTPKDQRY